METSIADLCHLEPKCAKGQPSFKESTLCCLPQPSRHKSQGKKINYINYDYIIIDEINMVPEIFHKFFCIIKRLKPNIKFIIASDYLQLLPVKDRIGKCDYKTSYCLYELVDANRLQLTKCRWSDDKLFNTLLPENILKNTVYEFNHRFTERHVTLTNKNE